MAAVPLSLRSTRIACSLLAMWIVVAWCAQAWLAHGAGAPLAPMWALGCAPVFLACLLATWSRASMGVWFALAGLLFGAVIPFVPAPPDVARMDVALPAAVRVAFYVAWAATTLVVIAELVRRALSGKASRSYLR